MEDDMECYAFPRGSTDDFHCQPGMTLRDWFAGQALAGLAANPGMGGRSERDCVKLAYGCADAMIAYRASK